MTNRILDKACSFTGRAQGIWNSYKNYSNLVNTYYIIYLMGTPVYSFCYVGWPVDTEGFESSEPGAWLLVSDL